MSVALPIIVLGGGLVALRMLRGTFQKAALKGLSRGEGAKLMLPKTSFEIAGKLEDIPLTEPSLKTAFTFKPILVRQEAPNKVPVVELTSGFRRLRRLLALRPKGPNLVVTVVASPSDLINLLTVAVVAGAIGYKASAGAVFWAGLGLLLAAELWVRLRISSESVKKTLEGMLSGPK
jgi:hypothetical protein